MPQFRQDVQVYATLYITADTIEEAEALAQRHCGYKEAFELPVEDLFIAGQPNKLGAIEVSSSMASFGLVGDIEQVGAL